MSDIYNDDFLRKMIKRIDDDCPLSDDFVDRVMYMCNRSRVRQRIKRYIFALIPILLIVCCIIFIPGLSVFILSMLSGITFMGILKYYTMTSIIILISFYVILTERIVKYVRRNVRNQQEPFDHLIL